MEPGALGRGNSLGKGMEARDYKCTPSYLWKLGSWPGSGRPSPENMSPGFCFQSSISSRPCPRPYSHPIAHSLIQGLTLT